MNDRLVSRMLTEECEDVRDYAEVFGDCRTAWDNCDRADWMLMVAFRLGVDRRKLAGALAECVSTVGHLIRDARCINTFNALRRYAVGEIEDGALKRYVKASPRPGSKTWADAAAVHGGNFAPRPAITCVVEAAHKAGEASTIGEHDEICADIVRKWIKFEFLKQRPG